MRIAVFIIVFIVSSAKVFSQKWPFELWHEGKIVLASGDTLVGLVKYDLGQDLVQYNLKDQFSGAYTARKVLFFEIFDNSIHNYRQFYALPYSAAGSYKAPVFFELLEEGKMTLLAREALEMKTYNSPYYIGSYTREVLVYKYFFLRENGDVYEFNGNKTELINMMGRYGEDVDKFIRKNKLKIEDKADFARIVDYYNSFFRT